MKIMTILTIVLILVFVFGGVDILVKHVKERGIECRALGIETSCGDYSIECAKDCQKLGQEYFKYSNTGFSRATCVCYLNKEVEQIW